MNLTQCVDPFFYFSNPPTFCSVLPLSSAPESLIHFSLLWDFSKSSMISKKKKKEKGGAGQNHQKDPESLMRHSPLSPLLPSPSLPLHYCTSQRGFGSTRIWRHAADTHRARPWTLLAKHITSSSHFIEFPAFTLPYCCQCVESAEENTHTQNECGLAWHLSDLNELLGMKTQNYFREWSSGAGRGGSEGSNLGNSWEEICE